MAAPIKHRFKKTGVNAGTTNFPNVFKIPPAKATDEIKNK
jgi:hypothetical protein